MSSDTKATSEKSVLVKKSSIDLNDSQNSPLKSYSNRAFSEGDKVYKHPDSELNQNESFSGGKGNIDKPLDSSTSPTTPKIKSQDTTTPLKSPQEQVQELNNLTSIYDGKKYYDNNYKAFA
ncbi:hypothetical protein HHE02_16430 [Helicobacter heilmannii]|nr:hypothetical protein ASB1_10560 [Helicobacter heilmannii]GMB94249.1 hypothetical protein NHP21011_03400 [Helicobacter heilmannii]CRF45125.1 hypothetical protein HHE014_00760 [Helicobacter heilmannii]CRF48318.1 hypothetical protein HHE02_16430 [Helicobacter heilmannii]